ncbi:MAG: DNA polymerase III subunit delta' [Proteobacteria bacterium]|nr:DNA polymerase III subunit delta' [Pseudomonadota bacterium]MBU1709557.1 DNA polymerase III subunit delta' [Pseudomonadota bacterium]
MKQRTHLQFSSLIGQQKAKDLLIKSFMRGRMSHAFLFRGPAGVGKKTAAAIFATLINCANHQAGESCGTCSSCVKFTAASHPDFHVIAPDGAAIKIKQVRDLKHMLTFPPFEADYRVVVLEDVHTMRREAANSLLKILEEPPENTLLILTADDSATVLPTIISRCQTIPFYPLSYDAVAGLLISEDIDPPTARTLAVASAGRIGQARLLNDKNLLPLRQEIISSLLALSPDQPEAVVKVFDLSEKSAKLKDNLEDLLNLLTLWLRDLILDKTSERTAQKAFPDHENELSTARLRWNVSELFDRIELIEKAKKQLLRNCNRAMVCEVLFFALL